MARAESTQLTSAKFEELSKGEKLDITFDSYHVYYFNFEGEEDKLI